MEEYIVMEGNLCKQGKRMKHWWKRYFVLSGHTLKYYSQKGGVLRSSIDVSGCSAKVVHRFLIGRDHTFQIAAKDTFFVVSANTNAEMHEWIQALNEAGGGHHQRDGIISPGSAMVALAARRQDDEIYNIILNDDLSLHDFIAQIHTRNEKILVKRNVDVKETQISSGSVLVAINGRTLVHEDVLAIPTLLTTSSFPLSLQFLRIKRKHGILRIMPYEGLNNVFSSWKERLCVLEGNSFTYLRKNDVCAKTEISLEDCSVKVIHKFLAGREFCFMISTKSSHLLFQALSTEDMLEWIGGIAHATEVSNGRIMHTDTVFQTSSSSSSTLTTTTTFSTPTKSSKSTTPTTPTRGGDCGGDSGGTQGVIAGTSGLGQTTDSSLLPQPPPNTHQEEGHSKQNDKLINPDPKKTVLVSDNEEDELHSTLRLTKEMIFPSRDQMDIHRSSSENLPSNPRLCIPSTLIRGTSDPSEPMNPMDIVAMVSFYQSREKFVEAIQLMRKNPNERLDYWRESFAWALEPTTVGYFNSLLQTKLCQRDTIQLTKDVPRTTNWLEHSSGVGKLDKGGVTLRLQHLRNVLHAYIASCAIGVVDGGGKDDVTPSAYLQGMNGITFVLLQAFNEDEDESFRFLTGIVEKLLPSIFESDSFGQETLGQTGQFFESIIASYLPEVVQVFERVGLPVFILAYKWFPTLFSDISLTAGNRQMPYNTILAAWDVCFLMGMDGAICVALALFSAAQGVILALPKDCLAEDVGFALNNILAQLTPEWLLDGVCVVIDTCNDEKLRKLRYQHMKQLHRSMKRKSRQHPTTRPHNSLPLNLDDFWNTTTGSFKERSNHLSKHLSKHPFKHPFKHLSNHLVVDGLTSHSNTSTTTTTTEKQKSTKDGETKDGETKDGETKNREIKNGEIKNGETKNGETKNGEIKNGEIKKGEIKNGEIKKGETALENCLIDERNIPSNSTNDVVPFPMMARNLDTGEVFVISEAGMTLSHVEST